MSALTDRPEIMLEVLAVLVRRLGGSVAIHPEDHPGPFNLMTKVDAEKGALYLVLDETLSADEVTKIQSGQFGFD